MAKKTPRLLFLKHSVLACINGGGVRYIQLVIIIVHGVHANIL